MYIKLSSQGLSRPCLPLDGSSPGFTDTCYCGWPYVVAGDSSSGPHTCTAGVLPTGPLLSPTIYLFIYGDKIVLCRVVWPPFPYLSASAFRVLGIQECTTILGFFFTLSILIPN